LSVAEDTAFLWATSCCLSTANKQCVSTSNCRDHLAVEPCRPPLIDAADNKYLPYVKSIWIWIVNSQIKLFKQT